MVTLLFALWGDYNYRRGIDFSIGKFREILEEAEKKARAEIKEEKAKAAKAKKGKK